MKDKKFTVLVLLAIAWLGIFIATLCGDAKLSPNVERAVTFLFLAWGAYWSLSYMFLKKPETKNNDSKPAEEPPKAPEHTDLPKS